MAKAWHEKPLWEKVFMAGDRVYLHAGKIIGHGGCSPFELFDQAKLLPDYDKYRYENAVRDLTVYSRRESPSPRYELTPTAKKVLLPIIGPDPTSPEYRGWWETRLVSVKAMREEGKEPEWAAEPPTPLEEKKEEKPKKRARRKAG